MFVHRVQTKVRFLNNKLKFKVLDEWIIEKNNYLHTCLVIRSLIFLRQFFEITLNIRYAFNVVKKNLVSLNLTIS